MEKPLVIISACLVGRNVRYDGTNKLNENIRDTVLPFIRPHPLCPEAGLGVPREPMHLEPNKNKTGSPRLVTNTTGIELTASLMGWVRPAIRMLKREKVSGAILKSRSPSCGPGAATIPGIFARELALALPLIPVIDEEAMDEPRGREAFIEKAHFYHEWLSLAASRPSLDRLMEFHERMEMVLLSHNEAGCRRLGELLSSVSGDRGRPTLFATYITRAMGILGQGP